MFKKLVARLVAAETQAEVMEVLYGWNKWEQGESVKYLFEHDKLSWKDHELLHELADKLVEAIAYKQVQKDANDD